MIKNNLKKRIFTSISLLSLLFLAYNFNLILVYSLIILGVLSIIEFLQITKKIFKSLLNFFIINSLFIIYVFLFCSLIFFFSIYSELKPILYIILIGCISSDIGGYIFGKIFKGPKLTNVSPNKTLSGAIGSFALTIAVVVTLFLFLTSNFNFQIIIIGLCTSASCQLGDLFFSFLKRKAKLKDTGNILPGHGGILDRLDGVFLGVPFTFLIIILLVK